MQQRIYTGGFQARHSTAQGFGHTTTTQDFDNPERMLFYAIVGGVLSWSVIGGFGWVVWKLIG